MEVINSQILLLEVRQSKEADQGYKEHMSYIEPCDLYIADLGYFDVETFRKIILLGAFFLSRYSKTCKLYNAADEEMTDLEKDIKPNNKRYIMLGRINE